MDFGPIPSTHGPAIGLSRTRWGLVAEIMLPEISLSSLHPVVSVLVHCSEVSHIRLPSVDLELQTETPTCNGWQREALRSSECNGDGAGVLVNLTRTSP